MDAALLHFALLEKAVDKLAEGAHEDFRLFLSAEPPPQLERPLPISLLQNSIKLTNEPTCSVLLDSYSKRVFAYIRLLQLDFLEFTKQFAAMADTVDIHILQVFNSQARKSCKFNMMERKVRDIMLHFASP